MKLLVTGASGLLGRYTVAEALRRGHEVRAMVRPTSDAASLPWLEDQRVEVVRCDLRSRHGLDEAVAGVDAVLHLAAAKDGDIHMQLAGTVVATENLLAAMEEAGVGRLVQVSSFAVYDFLRPWCFSVLDERSSTPADPARHSPYAQTKLMQETLARRWAERSRGVLTVLRPGVIFAPEQPWTARIGVRLSDRWWVRIGAWAWLPLSYAENCADVIVTCAEKKEAAGLTLNVHDDETPTQRWYARQLQRRSRPRPRIIPIPFTAMRSMVWAAALVNRVCFGGGAKVPQILTASGLHGRCKPLRYSNRRLHETLGWRQRVSLDEALRRCFPEAESDGAEVTDTGATATTSEAAEAAPAMAEGRR